MVFMEGLYEFQKNVTVGTAVKNKIKILFICNWNC